jgi:hypothetical protein
MDIKKCTNCGSEYSHECYDCDESEVAELEQEEYDSLAD